MSALGKKKVYCSKIVLKIYFAKEGLKQNFTPLELKIEFHFSLLAKFHKIYIWLLLFQIWNVLHRGRNIFCVFHATLNDYIQLTSTVNGYAISW